LYLKNRCFNFVNRRFNDLPPPRKPEIRPYLREEPRKVEEDFRFKFHQPERTRFPVSRLNLDHRRRKEEPPTGKPAGEENPAVRPRPTGRKNPQKERRCATLLFRRRRGV
jgi:hypothetical protein